MKTMGPLEIRDWRADAGGCGLDAFNFLVGVEVVPVHKAVAVLGLHNVSKSATIFVCCLLVNPGVRSLCRVLLSSFSHLSPEPQVLDEVLFAADDFAVKGCPGLGFSCKTALNVISEPISSARVTGNWLVSGFVEFFARFKFSV